MTTFADIAPTIAKLLWLLASDKSGEVAASAQALRRVLGSANLDLHDLANVVEFSARRKAPQVALTTADDDDVREMIRCCCAHPEVLSEKEYGFLASLMRWRGDLSPKQTKWLRDIHARIVMREASS